jgi:hypothetical protein
MHTHTYIYILAISYLIILTATMESHGRIPSSGGSRPNVMPRVWRRSPASSGVPGPAEMVGLYGFIHKNGWIYMNFSAENGDLYFEYLRIMDLSVNNK